MPSLTSGPDATSRDCLQKVYPVARFIAAGFAGSVHFGFWAVEDLRQQLRLDDPEGAWIPGWVAFKWYRRARRAFANAPETIRSRGGALMLVGVSPTADLGIPGWARPTVAIMRAPDFFPRVLNINAVEAIGTGAGIETYAEELRRLGRRPNALLQMEVGAPGGYASGLQHVIQPIVETRPAATVSSHVHLCLVRRGQIKISTSDYTHYSQHAPPVEVRMPPVATSWAGFQKLCSDAGVEATAATC